MSEQGVHEGTAGTPERPLVAARQEVQDPVAEGGVLSQGPYLIDEH